MKRHRFITKITQQNTLSNRLLPKIIVLDCNFSFHLLVKWMKRWIGAATVQMDLLSAMKSTHLFPTRHCHLCTVKVRSATQRWSFEARIDTLITVCPLLSASH